MDGTPTNLADEGMPPLIIKATDFGRADHLLTLVRSPIFNITVHFLYCPLQKLNAGGTGKIAYDPKQRDIRAFFSGATTAVAIEHCEKNTLDRIDGK
jgi:hypothetical protein